MQARLNFFTVNCERATKGLPACAFCKVPVACRKELTIQAVSRLRTGTSCLLVNVAAPDITVILKRRSLDYWTLSAGPGAEAPSDAALACEFRASFMDALDTLEVRILSTLSIFVSRSGRRGHRNCYFFGRHPGIYTSLEKVLLVGWRNLIVRPTVLRLDGEDHV